MTSSFSTITPLNTATVSKAPAYSKTQTQAQPQASSPMTSSGEPKKKNSHWFIKTLATAVVVVGGLAAARKWCPGVKDVAADSLKNGLQEGATIKGKISHYVAKAGQAIIDAGAKSWNWVASKFGGTKA